MRRHLAVALLLASSVAGAPPSAHAEFQANTYTTGTRMLGSVAASGAGFVVVWSSTGQDGDSHGVFGRRYDAAGTPLGGEFQVNLVTTGGQNQPAVAMDASGGFVVAWTDGGTPPFTFTDVMARRYDTGGLPLGGAFVVNTYTTAFQLQPAIATDGAGNFLVVWASETDVDEDWGIRGQRYDSAGTPLGGEFQVNTYTTEYQYKPAVAMHAGGGFVVVWQSRIQEGPADSGVFGQRYDAGGLPLGGEFHVNASTFGGQDYPGVAATAGGGFVVTWQDNSYDVSARRFDGSGAPLGGQFVVNSYPSSGGTIPAVGADGAGFVVVWHSTQPEPDFSTDIRGQRFDGSGLAVGSEFQVNTFTTGSQSRPRVAGDGTGNFVVVWNNSDGGFPSIAGQRNKPDRLVRGRRLQVRDRRGTEPGRAVVALGKESHTDVGPMVDGDPTVHGATLRVVANGTTGSDQTFVLDAAGWEQGAPGTFGYSGSTGGDGDPVKKAIVKRSPGGTALIKVILKGSIGTQSLDVVPPNVGTDGGLVLEIGGGGGRYCVTFGGASGGTEVQDTPTGWKVVSATAEPGCPAP